MAYTYDKRYMGETLTGRAVLIPDKVMFNLAYYYDRTFTARYKNGKKVRVRLVRNKDKLQVRTL